jgi:phosphosulfolactate phosphohydrolase-like enzyme
MICVAKPSRSRAQLCIGEVGGCAPPGFEFGNSPFEVLNVDFTEKVVIQRTSAGTQGIVAARHAKELYAASFVTTAYAFVSGIVAVPYNDIVGTASHSPYA